MQQGDFAVHSSPTWAFGILALLAMGLAVVALVAIVTALVAARKPIVRWETLKVLALAALCIVPALAVVAFIGYFTVAASHTSVHRTVVTETWKHTASDEARSITESPVQKVTISAEPLVSRDGQAEINVSADGVSAEKQSVHPSDEAAHAAPRADQRSARSANVGEPADAVAVRPETLGQFLHAVKTERQAPDWAEKGPVPEEDGVLVPLSSQRFATLAEAEQQVTAEAMAYMRKFYNDEYPLSGDWMVPVALIEKHAVRDIVGEELEKDFGNMYRAHLRLSLNSATRRAVHESWHDQIALHRLIGFGSALGMATLVLGTVAGYLKLDALTGGQYRHRLKLAAAALLAAGGLFAVIA